MEIIEHTEGRVPGPGFYRMPAKLYHADPCPEPSLSSSIAKMLIERSPEHAYVAHPRLGGSCEESDPTRPKEIGTAAHKLLLGQGRDLVIVEADDWKKGEARQARAEAYAAGNCPILRSDLDKAEAMAGRVFRELAEFPDCQGFADAPAEVVAIARDPSGAWLRIMMDRFEEHPRHAVIWDAKTSDQSSAPQNIGRRIEQLSMEVQAAFYEHVVALLRPHLAGRIVFRWIFVEAEPPNAFTTAEADGAAEHYGQRKLAAALHRWNACTATGLWPGYPKRIIRADFPEWAGKRWDAREESDPQLAGVNWTLAGSPFRPLDHGEAA